MWRALRLAAASAGRTAPNPGVGCAIFRGDRLLGEGRHRACGGPHAEVLALGDCRRRGTDPRGATVYVTLAPCGREGRTSPCRDALIAAGVGRVVVGCEDPSQPGSSEAFAAAGIDYLSGCLGAEAERLHGGFLRRIRDGRPRITAKWAMSLDGAIACRTGASRWISTAVARHLSRRRRRAFDAILIGAGTLEADDPGLFADDPARSPRPVVVSRHAAFAGREDLSLLAEGRDPAPWLVHDPQTPRGCIDRLGARGWRCLEATDAHDPAAVAGRLGEEGINDVLVEGGSEVHGAWLRAGVVDRCELYLGPRSLGGGMPVSAGEGVGSVADGSEWGWEETPRIVDGTLLCRLRALPGSEG